MMERFKSPNPTLFFILVVLCFTIPPTTSGKAEEEPANQKALKSAGKYGPLPDSIPFSKPVRGKYNGQQSQLGYPQEQDPNYPQQSIDQPSSGFSQPYGATTTNQPYSGLNQPFSTMNQPFRGDPAKQKGSLENAKFYNGVSKDKAFIRGVVLVPLLMVGLGF